MLTDAKVKALQPKDKDYKVSDAHGLYLHVHSNGSKYWRHNYRYNGKQKTISHGIYPEVSSVKAREKVREARLLLEDELDQWVSGSYKSYLRSSRLKLLLRISSGSG